MCKVRLCIPEDKLKIFMYKTAEFLRRENKNTKELVLAIGKFIKDRARSLPKQYKPKSILESRFTPAEEAFEKGMTSCGAITNISVAMLRHLGFKVKLIHGENKKSVDHAWISIYDPDKDLWTEYDLTEKNGTISPDHKKKLEVDSWEEIRDEIIEDHNTLEERRKQRTK